MQTQTCTAFAGGRRIACGTYFAVARTLKTRPDLEQGHVLVFDDRTGQQIDLDLRGSEADLERRFSPSPGELAADEREGRGRGRPKLGVTAREITLLPRHWDWLSKQPGGASVALRKLVQNAMSTSAGTDKIRGAQAAADGFMRALAGNLPGYEEAARALYARQRARFFTLTEPWPADVRDYCRFLAVPAFADS